MAFDPEITIFDWPDTFLVESREYDRDYHQIYDWVEPELYPYFVDLSEAPCGLCDCRDFRFNVRPYLNEPGHRQTCSHIIAATRCKNLLGTKPKKLPPTLNL